MKSPWFSLLTVSRGRAGWAAVMSLAITWMAGGCIGLQQYHTQPPAAASTPKELECLVGENDVPDRAGWKCGDAYIENRTEYLLGFAEFDDLGWAWNKQQQAELLSAIESEIAQGDALIVVFAHGWKHNASTCDNNVTCFRATLEQLYNTEVALRSEDNPPKPRRIIGVYIGWRGDSAKGKLLRQTTFFGRKGTAHQVGSGAVTELLVRLKELRAKAHEMRRESGQQSDTRLVVVGHSFGGALVFSATSQLIVERMAISAARQDRVEGFADLVVLVNPAFEAALYQPLHQAVIDRAAIPAGDGGFVPDQKPVFVIVTSQGDTATSKAFPAGRFVAANFLDDYRSGAEGATQKKANKTAVGHFAPYRTHCLKANELTLDPAKSNKARDKKCLCPYVFVGKGASEQTEEQNLATHRKVATKLRDLQDNFNQGSMLDFPFSRLIWEPGIGKDQVPYNSPLWVISAKPEIIARHSDIYQPAFVDFLSYLIMLATDDEERPIYAEGEAQRARAVAEALRAGATEAVRDPSPPESCEPDEGR